MHDDTRALATALIVEFEGLGAPAQWPGLSSGITLGYGYDLAHVREDMLRADWGPHLAAEAIDRLAATVGVSGTAARDLAPRFHDVEITPAAAADVLGRCQLPRYWNLTVATFPGAERTPAPAQAALLSLVFNRGTELRGERRREMRTIRQVLASTSTAQPDLQAVAREIVAMKRLWVGKGYQGLLDRRDAEAALISAAAGGEHVRPADVLAMVRLIRARARR